MKPKVWGIRCYDIRVQQVIGEDTPGDEPIEVIEKEAFDKAIEVLKWIKKDILYDRQQDPILKRISKLFKELGEI